ncbi:MAG TPA: PepSY domain-containing protein [Roseiarcus sp.]|nr:PepSY domain-containing protein [Roseiarcus sp.]
MHRFIVSGLIATTVAASAAHAESLGRPCTDKPESAYLSVDALKAKLAEQGFEIRNGEIKNACAEFYVLDKGGRRAELFLDPTSGVIISGEPAKSEAKGETVGKAEKGGETIGKAEKEGDENEASEEDND